MDHRAASPVLPSALPDADPSGDGEGAGFDEILARLRAVVERLEQGSLSLEQSLSAYEEGVRLAHRGHGLLDAAEKRVELLVQERGVVSRVPFDDACRGEGGEDVDEETD